MLIGYLTSGALGVLDFELLKWAFARWPKLGAWLNTPKRILAYATTMLLVAGLYALVVSVRGLPAPVDGIAWLTTWGSFCVPAFLANQLTHSAVKDREEKLELAAH